LHAVLATLALGSLFVANWRPSEGLTLSCEGFGGTKINEFDDTIVVEEDVWKGLERIILSLVDSQLTLWLDVTVHDIPVM
jgi:hypothetical protein